MPSFRSHLIYFFLSRRLAKLRQGNLSLAEVRALRDEEAEDRFPLPAGVLAERAYVAGVSGEWLRPDSQRLNSNLVLYLHGGAYVQGSVKTHRALAARLALASNASVLVMDYRLAPEHPYPAALDDALAVYQALRADHANRSIALAGDSAGGGLALALALRIRTEGREPPTALALLSPWTDLTLGNGSHLRLGSVDPYFPTHATLRSAAAAYGAAMDLTNPLISPQFADLHGLPPTLIHVGSREALLDDSRVLALKMQDHGTAVEIAIYSNMWHVWQIFGGRMPEADQSLRQLGAFLKARCRKF